MKYFLIDYTPLLRHSKVLLVTDDDEGPIKQYDMVITDAGWVHIIWKLSPIINYEFYKLHEIANYRIEEITEQEAFAELL